MDETIYTVDMGGGKSQCLILENVSPTLTTTHYGEPVVIYDEDIHGSAVLQVERG